jgi:hypothetical protein
MFASIEQAIVARLQAKLPDGVLATSLAELARVPELRQKAPAVFVVFEGYTQAATNTNVPHIQQIEMSWAVVVAAKNAAGNGDPQSAKEDASEIAGHVLTALLGFDTGGGRRLVLSQAPGPEYDGGFCYLPIGFSCRATFKGDPV